MIFYFNLFVSFESLWALLLHWQGALKSKFCHPAQNEKYVRFDLDEPIISFECRIIFENDLKCTFSIYFESSS